MQNSLVDALLNNGTYQSYLSCYDDISPSVPECKYLGAIIHMHLSSRLSI